MQLAADAQRLAQPARPGAQESQLGQAPALLHHCQPLQRLYRPQQYTGAVAGRPAHQVQAPVQAIRAVHIGMAWRPKHGRIARRGATKAVRSRVVLVIGLGFHNSPAHAIHQQDCTNQLPGQHLRRRQKVQADQVLRKGGDRTHA